jgi:hypothetical protein
VSASSELSTVTATVAGGAAWNLAWPANADGSYTLAPIASESVVFQQPPADDAAAYRRAAYWTAISARALGDRTLAATSAGYAARATAAMASFETSNRATILTEAAQAIRSELPTTAARDAGEAQRRSIALIAANYLQGQAAPASLQRGTEQDDSWLASLRREYDRIKATISTAIKVAAIGAGIVCAAVVAGLVWWYVGRGKK